MTNVIKKESGWAFSCPVVTLPCKHAVIVPPSWIDADGRVLNPVGCTTCRARFEITLEGWAPIA